MPKILIIDDDRHFGTVLGVCLRREGYEVTTTSSGAEGLETARTAKPDLIVCDLQMPGMDGQEVVQALRADAKLAEIPVIFLSGCTERGQIRRSINLGGDDFLTKPAEMPEILEAVKARLSRREKQRQRLDQQLDQAAQVFVGIVHDLQKAGGEVRWLADMPADMADHPNKILQKVRQSLNAGKAAASPGETSPATLLVKSHNRQHFLKLSEVKALMACGEYADIYWGKDQHLMFRKPLKQWEAELPPEQFLRVHRQAIVNLAFLDFVEKDANGRLQIHLRDFKQIIPVSQRETSEFNRRLKKFQAQ